MTNEKTVPELVYRSLYHKLLNFPAANVIKPLMGFWVADFTEPQVLRRKLEVFCAAN